MAQVRTIDCGSLTLPEFPDQKASVGLLATTYGARNVRMDLDGPLRAAWEKGHVPAGDLWSFYRRYPYLTRLRDRSVLEGALRSGLDDMMWQSDGFALAESYDDPTGHYVGLATYESGSFASPTDSTLIVHPARAATQRETEVARPTEDEEVPAARPRRETGTRGDESNIRARVCEQRPTHGRFFGVARINPERYSRDLTRIAQEVLQHLAAVDGVDLKVTVEITAVAKGGFAEDRVRAVLENAKTLKFDQYGFEAT